MPTAKKPKKIKKPKRWTPKQAVSPEMAALRGVVLGLLREHWESKVESLGAFGRRAGISDSTMSDLMTGNRAMGLDALMAVVAALGLNLGVAEAASKVWATGTRPASACFCGPKDAPQVMANIAALAKAALDAEATS